MKKTLNKVAYATIGMILGASAALAEPESKDPIKLTINEWTGQVLTTHIAGELLDKMGYNVEYVTAGYFPQMTALQDNTVTAALEIWTTNIADAYEKAIGSGNVKDIGSLGLQPIETWFYPAFVEELCPGLPDWEALKSCPQTFATAETIPQGRLVDYPADWGTSNRDRLTGLELPFTSIPAGSEGALVAEIKTAFARKTPLLVMFFSPHWLFSTYDMRPVKLPPYTEGCNEDPKVGVNPNATFDCDFVRGDVRKVAWAGMEEKWPNAYALLEALEISNEQQIELINMVDQKGQSIDEAVAYWLKNNESSWSSWLDAAQQ
ncbi:ABC transporter substrate-binding protein [Roseovarius pelagicus]|uniref:ABC transporter substrate-binding protein n=1 Tax=Roseovarius pelagicus TaxID=2980108 RepID=A0ABY6D5T2_9RHOB|nr:ABC transporter substrate-binding protein [Roseovarius pelagicus]UXX81506.1 ABC transporter substrate-binding protein [Roseovarius pelagicus]